MTARSCVKCVSLSQRHMQAHIASAETFSTSAVGYVAAQATLKVIEAQMWEHVKVCKE